MYLQERSRSNPPSRYRRLLRLTRALSTDIGAASSRSRQVTGIRKGQRQSRLLSIPWLWSTITAIVDSSIMIDNHGYCWLFSCDQQSQLLSIPLLWSIITAIVDSLTMIDNHGYCRFFDWDVMERGWTRMMIAWSLLQPSAAEDDDDSRPPGLHVKFPTIKQPFQILSFVILEQKFQSI